MNRRILFRLAVGLAAMVLGASAQQSVRVLNAASFLGFPLSPGCWGSVFIDPPGGLAGVTNTAADVVPFPTTLGGVQVTINGVEAPMNFAGPNQVNFLVPKETPEGQVAFRVIVNGAVAVEKNITIFPISPGLLSIDPGNVNPPAAAVNEDGTCNGPLDPTAFCPTGLGTAPAQRGKVVSLYGVGADFAELPEEEGGAAPLDRTIFTVETPEAFVFGQSAVVQFSGLAPGLVNAWQLNIVVPSQGFVSGQVPVSASVLGVETNVVTIQVAE